MKTAIATLRSVSPYSQSRPHDAERLEKEGADAYENRTWREKAHTNDAGNVFIPPMAFKNCIDDAAKYLSIQIKGKGKSTYTKHIEAGVICTDPLVLPIKKNDLLHDRLYLNSDGVRNSGKRVWRVFPLIPSWDGNVTFTILDETVTEDVFKEILIGAGQFIGIGRFRPRNRGFYGRFSVDSLTVE